MKLGMIRLGVLQACFLILLSAAAVAEAPWHYQVLTVNRGGTTVESALPVCSTTQGHVAYHQARPEAPALWLEIDAQEGKAIPLRLGVPMLDRYRQARPAIAILGPDLPPYQGALPFEVPEGLGVQILSTQLLKSAQYRDNYTGVISWRFEKMSFTPPTTDSYYAVVFSQPVDGESLPECKFWVTAGEGSSFRFSNFFTLYGNNVRIRSFFEEAVFTSQVFFSSLITVILTVVAVIVAIL